MRITKITIKKLEGHEYLKGVASVVFDDAFKIREIKILKQNDGSLKISMPSKEIPNGTRVSLAYPVSNEARVVLENSIINEYNKIP